MSYYLVLVGTLDNPLYETYLTSAKASSSTTISITSPTAQQTNPQNAQTSHQSPTSFSIFGTSSPNPPPSSGPGGTKLSNVGYGHKTGPNGKHVMQLVAHASLDVVEDVQWTNGAMYLKSIDKFHEWTVSVWLTPGGVKIILLHELKNDDGIRLFFQETWENYVKTLLNPFHELNAPIRSPTFDQRIKASAKKHL
ncbi:TRAPP subunit TRS20 [Sporobolomyces salmoneus]|uniref:TRAPP subunit TRS20 n=1 Tax=Sporobolomyces salmoneus TaxID=183962 RepID=UPI00316B7D60